MSIILIVVLVLVVLVFGASFVLGRATSEVESARDTEYLELEGVLDPLQRHGRRARGRPGARLALLVAPLGAARGASGAAVHGLYPGP